MGSRVLKVGENQITQNYAAHCAKVNAGTGWAIGTDVVKKSCQLEYIKAHSSGTVLKVINNMSGTNKKLDAEGMGYGNYVMILHDNNYVTLYAHLANVMAITVGRKISEGTIIGYMGNTGNSSGGHLHFELRKYKAAPDVKTIHDTSKFTWLNPEPYLNADLPGQNTTASYMVNGINYDKVFDPTYYVDKYADLKKAFGTDTASLWGHFCNYGMKEHRQACADFNVDIYKDNYTDLQVAFGSDIQKYYRHYCEYGYKEGRNAKTSLTKKPLTATSYPDLVNGSYRVRLSFNDNVNSAGSYSVWRNAYNAYTTYLCKGYHVYDTTGKQLD